MTTTSEIVPTTRGNVAPVPAAPTTASTRKTAIAVGLLFLNATAAFIVADTLTSGILNRPDFLAGAWPSPPPWPPERSCCMGSSAW